MLCQLSYGMGKGRLTVLPTVCIGVTSDHLDLTALAIVSKDNSIF